MKWYYAVGQQQQGPLDDAQLDALIAAGTVTPDTLIWREGQANWQPLRIARPGVPVAPPGAIPPFAAPPGAASAAAAPPGQVQCAECRAFFAKEDTIQYGSVNVCATCKPIFVQRLREGAAPTSSFSAMPNDSEELLRLIRERGYALDMGSCISRGWEMFKKNPGTSIGAVFLIYACLIVASFIPCAGSIIQLVVQGPLLAGLYWFFLKMIRGENASVRDAFAGFSRAFLQLFLTGLISGLLAGLCITPFVVAVAIAAQTKGGNPNVALMAILGLIGFIPMVYLTVAWIFSMPLVIDKGMPFWNAMELSRKVVSMHWFSIFGFLFLCGAISMLGAVALCVGLLVSLPVAMAAMTYAYEDIFGTGQALQS